MIRPDDENVARYREQVQRRSTRSRRAGRSARPARRDARRHAVSACRPTSSSRTKSPRASGAMPDGIGLYRTEFLYLGADVEPTEEDHFRAYREVVQAMGDRPVVIRTLDLGADKMGHLPRTEDEHNPFLGLRSIRLSLRNVDLFRTQLRAILRASAWATSRSCCR